MGLVFGATPALIRLGRRRRQQLVFETLTFLAGSTGHLGHVK
jgi:hypothetical protein